MRILAIGLIGVVLIGALAWVVPPAEAAEKTVEIKMKNIKFVPSAVSVAKGDNVTLVLINEDGFAHTFTMDSLADYNLNIEFAAHESKNVTFQANKAGTFGFHCDVVGHKSGGMTGTLTVTGEPAPRTPGFEVPILVAALALIVVAVRYTRRK